MEYTPIRSVTAVEHPAADRASAYGLESILGDGNDADVMYGTALQTIGKARDGGGPSLVEAVTYRHGGHSRADPAKYRPDAEVREWLRRDPVKRYREQLLAAGAGEAELNEIETRAQQKVDAATDEARQGAPARVDQIERQVWADGGSAWRN
jgi:pyruvate dehydrogenase E1 component alpha subunit